MHNSKSIIMITTICCIYCCKQLVYLSTRSLVHLSTCQLFKVPLSSSQATCSLVNSSTCQLVHLSTRPLVNSSTCPLVNSSTCQLVHILTNKGNEKKQNRKCLYSKYLIMGIGNGMKKVITGIFLHE